MVVIGGLMSSDLSSKNSYFKRVFIYVFMFLVVTTLVLGATRANQEEDYDQSFLNMKNIVNKTYMEVFDAKGWWYYNARSYNSIDLIDFRKDFWMPIEPWEYEVCSKGLSTQLTYEGNAGAGSIFSGIYADTVTVAAYKLLPERTSDIDSSKLYEVSWYFHPADNGKYYSIKLVNSVNGKSKIVQARTGASTKSGAAGYYAFYSIDDYDKVVLSDESTPQDFTFNIVEGKDSNR
jgi:hypothetical protein